MVRRLFVIVGALLGVVIVVSLFRDAPAIEMVPLMLVQWMGAVPVALPVMFTVSVAVVASAQSRTDSGRLGRREEGFGFFHSPVEFIPPWVYYAAHDTRDRT